ncbi:MAG: hypothetical protein RR382_05455 [Tannerellaceae bacterium]
MESYRPLYRIITEHDYFVGKPCAALECRLSPQGKSLARQRGLLFRQLAANEWEVLFDAASADATNDVLELELSVSSDPNFVLYTEWKDFCPTAAYRLQLPLPAEEKDAASAIRLADGKRKIGSSLCTVHLHLTQKLIEAAKAEAPEVCRLHFHTPKRYWEYIFLPRNDDGSVPSGELQLEDTTGQVAFCQFYKTQAYGREAWCVKSTDAIPVRSTYECRLRLVVKGSEEELPKRILLRQVESPILGRFQSSRIDCMQQVCYY